MISDSIRVYTAILFSAFSLMKKKVFEIRKYIFSSTKIDLRISLQLGHSAWLSLLSINKLLTGREIREIEYTQYRKSYITKMIKIECLNSSMCGLSLSSTLEMIVYAPLPLQAAYVADLYSFILANSFEMILKKWANMYNTNKYPWMRHGP